jgi:CheY-like chemotaxis protein
MARILILEPQPEVRELWTHVAERLGLSLGVSDDSLRCLFSGCVGLLLTPELGAPPDPSA